VKFSYSKLFLLLIFPLSVFLAFNKHSKDDFSSYHSVIWADAAGYYVYLPMSFLYDNAAEYPDSIIEKTGQGFKLDTIRNVVLTKYPYGVSILQAPFFLISHLAAKILNGEANGFSKIYHWGILICGVFYACFGMYLLSRHLQSYFSHLHSFLYVLVLYLSTNLYYYSIDNNAMSHVYSFFIFSSILFLTPKFYESISFRKTIILSILFSIALLIRPTNVLIVLFFILYNIGSLTDFKDRLQFFRNHLNVLICIPIVVLIMFLPQMIYWKKTFGSWFHYSYGEESFSNWNHPEIIKEWFSTNNGLFIYAPLLLLSVAGIILMIKRRIQNGFLIGIIFLLASYIFSSWWVWWFGCSYGARSFVEYYSLFIIPLGYFIEFTRSKKWKTAIGIFILLCITINLNIIYYYGGCFYGNNWDWDAYWKLHL
jgi:hypothetical protein